MRLKPLLRYRKWQVDEERRILAALMEEATNIETRITTLKAERTREIADAGADLAITNIGAYLVAVETKLETLAAQLAKKETEIDAQRDKVADVYKDLKTVEIADERADAKERASIDLVEQNEMEEATRRPVNDGQV